MRVLLASLSRSPGMVRYVQDVRTALRARGIEKLDVVGECRNAWKASSPADAEAYDVVHICSPSPSNVALILRRRRVPVVVSMHDPEPHAGEGIRTLALRGYNQVVWRRAEGVVVHARKWLSAGRRARGVVRYAPLAVTSQGTVRSISGHPHFLYFGRIRPYKGLDIYIEAIRRFQAIYSGARFTIAGEGPLQIDLRNLPESVRVINRGIREEELPALFGDATVVVLPYTSATQSGIIPLAYGFGRPVICSDVGALGEHVKDGTTGWLVTPRSVDELVGAMEQATDRERVKQYGHNALEYYRESLSVDAMGARIVELYEEVLRSGSQQGHHV